VGDANTDSLLMVHRCNSSVKLETVSLYWFRLAPYFSVVLIVVLPWSVLQLVRVCGERGGPTLL
jgi:hypothetical protein